MMDMFKGKDNDAIKSLRKKKINWWLYLITSIRGSRHTAKLRWEFRIDHVSFL